MAKYDMQPEELQALREQADLVGLRDVEVGKFLKLLIPHVAHLYGLDPVEEDQRLLEEAARREEELRGERVAAVNEETLTPAQKESKAQAEAQGREYALPQPGEDPTLDPVAKETQESGATTVPSAQLEEQEPETNTLDPSVSTYPSFSSPGSQPPPDKLEPPPGDVGLHGPRKGE